jgi:dTDP-4-amino-4,6-dideoxygalactose transaminase
LDDSVRAVVPVHYAGVGCDIAGLRRVVDGTRAEIIEDNAHGLFGMYRGEPLGSFGRASTLSFHETKNFICGEGGAVVLNDPEDTDRAHILLDKGTNRRLFTQGQVDKYTWVDTGSSFGMSDLLAAFLLGQLETKDDTLAKRRVVAEAYAARLSPFEANFNFRCMHVPDDRVPAFHMFYVLLPTASARDTVLQSLIDAGIRATFHYVPLHSAPGARRFSDSPSSCPVTDDVSARLLRLPFYNGLTELEIDRVAGAFIRALDQIDFPGVLRAAGV